MDCNPLWFIKCDSVLLAEPLDYSKMIGYLFRNLESSTTKPNLCSNVARLDLFFIFTR